MVLFIGIGGSLIRMRSRHRMIEALRWRDYNGEEVRDGGGSEVSKWWLWWLCMRSLDRLDDALRWKEFRRRRWVRRCQFPVKHAVVSSSPAFLHGLDHEVVALWRMSRWWVDYNMWHSCQIYGRPIRFMWLGLDPNVIFCFASMFLDFKFNVIFLVGLSPFNNNRWKKILMIVLYDKIFKRTLHYC